MDSWDLSMLEAALVASVIGAMVLLGVYRLLKKS
jgi:uncharacterized membrane protein YeaQ/YmgE (transglycosylase-associated protein family)